MTLFDNICLFVVFTSDLLTRLFLLFKCLYKLIICACLKTDG